MGETGGVGGEEQLTVRMLGKREVGFLEAASNESNDNCTGEYSTIGRLDGGRGIEGR